MQHSGFLSPIQQQGRHTAFEALAGKVDLLLEGDHLQTERSREGIISVLGGEKFHCLSSFWLVEQDYLFQEISLLFWLEANKCVVYLCSPREHLQHLIFETHLSSEYANRNVIRHELHSWYSFGMNEFQGIHSGIC
ncbi:hypothetical protein NPIL_626501 [Nephila pilipes]|uniref:Uncharacterized protein n=1 Tax=Nephila pilipes TaxID=299642 RepID=A0A8X6TQF8_NEPPI|nr:hypothetical protein NPIL_626501 [Nephila pilipes]